MLAVLPRAGRPRQVDREHQRDHVRIRRAAERVAHLGAPVGPSGRSRELGLRRRDRLLRPGELQLGLRVDVGETRVVRHPADVRRIARRTIGIGADVAGECDARAPRLRCGVRRAIAQVDHHALHGDQLALRRLAGAVRRRDRRHGKLGLGDLRGDHALCVGGVTARKPRRRGVALDGERRRLDGDRAPFGIALGALRLELALFRAREFLHQPDLRHRHEIARERPGVRTLGRHVLDADLELRIGQLAARDGHFARRVDHRALRDELLRVRHGELERFGERQRRVLGVRRAARQHSSDGDRGGAPPRTTSDDCGAPLAARGVGQVTDMRPPRTR